MTLDKQFILTDEEIRQALKEANRKAQDYGDDNEPLPERAVAQAQLKKIHDWGKESCPHFNGVFSPERLNKHQCSLCWQSLIGE